MIADLTAPRFRECEGQDDPLSDITVAWAILNFIEQPNSGQSVTMSSWRSQLVNHIDEHDLTVTDLFENLMGAVEEDDLVRFGLSPPAER